MNLFSKLDNVLSELELEKKKIKSSKCKHIILIEIEKTLNKFKAHISSLSELTNNKYPNQIHYYNEIKHSLFLLSTDTRNKIKIYKASKRNILLQRDYKIIDSLYKLRKNIDILRMNFDFLSEKASYINKINSSIIRLYNHMSSISYITNLANQLNYQNNIFVKISDILYQGSLENDERFLNILNESIKIFENYENEDFLKLSIQFSLAQKYIKDIISLKKIFILKNSNNK
ncbi:hypothetical protein H312_00718 [Anncaliia algerae PRA339]|uniref:Uncharacterized protein n=1 Tax=Anncaliia algerae PRA339 TaxID=1288291 RepID=A0A059F487_9MICR|nr:hypothetical protein H312_00718 [Anncaliia algerae PRA339]